ncbi:MAG: methyltransferase [Luteimonas sp.]
MGRAYGDPALDALLLPFADGGLPRVPGALFLRARAGAALQPADWPGLHCEQGWKPAADALARSGFDVQATAGDSRHPLVLVLPPRQRDEARALIGEAFARAAPGGTVIAAMANDAGAKSGETDFARIAGAPSVRSKHKCRVFWASADVADTALIAQWRSLDAPRAIGASGVVSRPGVFAWDRVDAASALLAAHLPADLAGRVADLGAGWGFLAMEVLRRCGAVTAIDLYEAEVRALELARHNLGAFDGRAALGFHWHDVATGVPGTYDAVVSNPPFHGLDGRDQPALGRAFIASAASALRPGGRLLMVANRHLPYEQALTEAFAEVRTLAQDGGFKIVEARKAGR